MGFQGSQGDVRTLETEFHMYLFSQLFEDIENIMKVALMGANVRLKPDAVPHRFDCQPNRSTAHHDYSWESGLTLHRKVMISNMLTVYKHPASSVPDEERCLTEMGNVSPESTQGIHYNSNCLHILAQLYFFSSFVLSYFQIRLVLYKGVILQARAPKLRDQQ